MQRKNKRVKKISDKKKVHAIKRSQIGIRIDDELEDMVRELREKLDLESDSQVGRYAIKRLHRKLVLNEIDPK